MFRKNHNKMKKVKVEKVILLKYNKYKSKIVNNLHNNIQIDYIHQPNHNQIAPLIIKMKLKLKIKIQLHQIQIIKYINLIIKVIPQININ